MFSRTNFILGVVLWPLLLISLGLMFILQILYDNIPNPDETIELKGTLKNYKFVQLGRGYDDYELLLSYKEYSALFIDSYINKDIAKNYLKYGVKVSFHIAKSDSVLLEEKVKIPTWSTTINGHVLQSLNDELKLQSIGKYTLAPILGVISIIFGIIFFLRQKKYYSRY
jgi:hypothetical protein